MHVERSPHIASVKAPHLLVRKKELRAADTKEAAPKEEYENEADVNLSEGFLPIKLLIRIAEKFDLQHLNFHSYQLLIIPMKLDH